MLLTSHLNHPDILDILSEAETLRRWVLIEVALAEVQGSLGIIDQQSVAQISRSALHFQPNVTALEVAMEQTGVPIAELVKQLRKHVGPPAADLVHHGATTQDIMDTAFVMQIRDALDVVIEPLLDQVISRLATLADEHRATLMAGRTHSQQALPITFGVKVANWLAPLLRHRERLTELRPRLLVIQFGGAAGTLAALGEDGLRVQRELAHRLNLSVPLTTWHTQRDGLVEFANWLVLLTGSLAKMATDIILLAQNEVGEVVEGGDPARGGSSTMPQKRNPMTSEAIVAIHRMTSGHLSTLHGALLHQHERATDSWQAEWYAFPAMLSKTAAALEKAGWLAENLVVNATKMQRNVAESNGMMLAEAVTFALAKTMPRVDAVRIVQRAIQIAIDNKQHLVDAVKIQVKIALDWETLRTEHNHLGVAHAQIDQVLNAVKNYQ